MADAKQDKCAVPAEYYAAVDIGASSGRVLAAYLEGEDDAAFNMVYQEVYRFDNKQVRRRGHDCWDVEYLYTQVSAGLKAFFEQMGQAPVSLGIDTWGVDFVLLDEHDQLIGDAVAYRDARTDGIPELIDIQYPDLNLYERTGIQRQGFNTIYQLCALKAEHPEELAAARTFLTIPDYLIWRLTGKKVNEYTNASTTGMLDAKTCDWDRELIETLGLPSDIFLTPTMPGAQLGSFTAEVTEQLGYNTQVVLVASHDTGSAYLAVPARDDNAAYISSGTWSLLGVENAEPITSPAAQAQNFTNEGGWQKRYRFLKNIMGLWMSQSVRREFNGVRYVEDAQIEDAQSEDSQHADAQSASTQEGSDLTSAYHFDHEVGFGELVEWASDAIDFPSVVDANDNRFLAPSSMIEEIKRACLESNQSVPQTPGEIMSVIYHSLVACYKDAVQGLEQLTNKTYTSINIVGGGCQDELLNQMCADACGIPVFAGPVEGTCIGNFMVQMIADGAFRSLADARACVAHSFDIKRYDPTK